MHHILILICIEFVTVYRIRMDLESTESIWRSERGCEWIEIHSHLRLFHSARMCVSGCCVVQKLPLIIIYLILWLHCGFSWSMWSCPRIVEKCTMPTAETHEMNTVQYALDVRDLEPVIQPNWAMGLWNFVNITQNGKCIILKPISMSAHGMAVLCVLVLYVENSSTQFTGRRAKEEGVCHWLMIIPGAKATIYTIYTSAWPRAIANAEAGRMTQHHYQVAEMHPRLLLFRCEKKRNGARSGASNHPSASGHNEFPSATRVIIRQTTWVKTEWKNRNK